MGIVFKVLEYLNNKFIYSFVYGSYVNYRFIKIFYNPGIINDCDINFCIISISFDYQSFIDFLISLNLDFVEKNERCIIMKSKNRKYYFDIYKYENLISESIQKMMVGKVIHRKYLRKQQLMCYGDYCFSLDFNVLREMADKGVIPCKIYSDIINRSTYLELI